MEKSEDSELPLPNARVRFVMDLVAQISSNPLLKLLLVLLGAILSPLLLVCILLGCAPLPAVLELLSPVGIILPKLWNNPNDDSLTLLIVLLLIVFMRFVVVLFNFFYVRFVSLKRRLITFTLWGGSLAVVLVLGAQRFIALSSCVIIFSSFVLLSEYWVSISKNNVLQAEKELFLVSGFQVEVKICPRTGISWVHIPCSNHDKPVLVMTHGWSGGKALYAPILKRLQNEYSSLYLVDFIGMGTSHRPFFFRPSSEKVMSLFLNTLNVWRKTQHLESFVLLGHSLGGYLSVLFALKHPEVVSRLILLSPVGMPEQKKNYVWPVWVERFWSFRIAPQVFLKPLGPLTKTFLTRLVQVRLGHDIPHADHIARYLYSINFSPVSSEVSLVVLLRPGAFAYQPLEKKASEELQCPTTFVYGSFDWMDLVTGSQISANLRERGIASETFILFDAGHQLFLENQQGCSLFLEWESSRTDAISPILSKAGPPEYWIISGFRN
jgi:cardiolipin-specific phospholipase